MKGLLAPALLITALSVCNLTGNLSDSNNSNSTNTQTAGSSENKGETTDTQQPPLPPSTPHGGQSSSGAPISGGVLNGKAVSLPQPAYPPVAKAAHASGQVVVQVTVDENGNVIAAQAVSGHPLLQQSAVNAARQAHFSPTLLSGRPVKVNGTLIYNFVAQ